MKMFFIITSVKVCYKRRDFKSELKWLSSLDYWHTNGRGCSGCHVNNRSNLLNRLTNWHIRFNTKRHRFHGNGSNDPWLSGTKWRYKRCGIWIPRERTQWSGYQWHWLSSPHRGSDGSKCRSSCWFNADCLGRGWVCFSLRSACVHPVLFLPWHWRAGSLLLTASSVPGSMSWRCHVKFLLFSAHIDPVHLSWPCHATFFLLNACVDPVPMMPWSCHARFIVVGKLVKSVHQLFVWSLRRVNLNVITHINCKWKSTVLRNQSYSTINLGWGLYST